MGICVRIVCWSVVSGFAERETRFVLEVGRCLVHAHTDSAAVADPECHHANRCLESTARIQVFSWIFTLAGEWCVGNLLFHFPPHLLGNIRRIFEDKSKKIREISETILGKSEKKIRKTRKA